MHKYSWAKESSTLYRKPPKKNIKKSSDVNEVYWSDIATKLDIKGTNNDK